MQIQCPQCKTKYRVDEKKVAARSDTRLRCANCGAQFKLEVPAAEEAAEATLPSGSAQGPALPPDKTVSLSVTQGPLKGKIFPVSKARITLGRTGTDIVVDDAEVSRKHCALEIHGNTATVLDLGSRNGVFVDQERVQSAELEHFSEFRIGVNTFLFTVTDKA